MKDWVIALVCLGIGSGSFSLIVLSIWIILSKKPKVWQKLKNEKDGPKRSSNLTSKDLETQQPRPTEVDSIHSNHVSECRLHGTGTERRPVMLESHDVETLAVYDPEQSFEFSDPFQTSAYDYEGHEVFEESDIEAHIESSGVLSEWKRKASTEGISSRQQHRNPAQDDGEQTKAHEKRHDKTTPPVFLGIVPLFCGQSRY